MKSHAKAATQGTDGSASASTPQSASTSNQEAAQDIGSTGLQNYTETLGTWLGTELYEAVHDALTEDSFAGYTKDALGAIFDLLSSQGQALEGSADPAQVQGFVDALQARLGPIAEAWLAAEGQGLRERLRSWVDANPVAIVGTALLAATGAVLADLDVPTLEREFDLGKGVTGSLGADLGSLRNLALEQVRASLDVTSGPLVAAVNLSTGGTGVVGDASVKVAGDRWSGHLDASIDEAGSIDGAAGVGHRDGDVVTSAEARVADGSYQGYQLSQTRTDGPITDTLTMSNLDDLWSASGSRSYSGDTWSAALTGTVDGEGRASASGDLTYAQDDLSLSAEGQVGPDGLQYDLSSAFGSENRRFGLGLSGTDGDWRASGSATLASDEIRTELQGWLRSDGGVGGSVSFEATSGDWQAGGNTTFAIGDEQVLDVGLHAGFRSRTEFRTWLGRYAYDSAHDNHTFSLLAEEKLGSIYTRLQHSTVVGATGTQFDTRIHGGYFLDQSRTTAIIGGVRHLRDFDGSESISPEIGLQLEDHALTLGYDTEREAVMLNFVLPFGR